MGRLVNVEQSMGRGPCYSLGALRQSQIRIQQPRRDSDQITPGIRKRWALAMMCIVLLLILTLYLTILILQTSIEVSDDGSIDILDLTTPDPVRAKPFVLSDG